MLEQKKNYVVVHFISKHIPTSLNSGLVFLSVVGPRNETCQRVQSPLQVVYSPINCREDRQPDPIPRRISHATCLEKLNLTC